MYSRAHISRNCSLKIVMDYVQVLENDVYFFVYKEEITNDIA